MRNKCKCEHFQQFCRENYICFEYLQILHAEYEYNVRLWIVLIFEYEMYFVLWKSAGYNLRKVQFPYFESRDFNVKISMQPPKKKKHVI